jgi:hypothetical protein
LRGRRHCATGVPSLFVGYMTAPVLHAIAMLATAALIAGCTSTGGPRVPTTEPARFDICHGYGCHYKTRLDFGAADAKRLAAIMASGADSAAAERRAVSRAVQYFEKQATQTIGIRDRPKSDFGKARERGQMDCVDESTNTRAFLLYLERRGMLRHHTVAGFVQRGFLFDGRYPHATAVLEGEDGTRWAVDSWFEPGGGAPDIMPLSDWMKRGVMGVR